VDGSPHRFIVHETTEAGHLHPLQPVRQNQGLIRGELDGDLFVVHSQNIGLAKPPRRWKPVALDCRISQGAGVSTEESPVEHEDRWILNLRGMSVTRISVDFRLVLALDSGWEVAWEAPVNLAHGTAHANPSVLVNPESQDAAAALALFGAKVLSAIAFKSGTLRLVFDTGHHLTCSSDPSLEAWQVTGPTGWRFASLPGGDLAVWSGSGASES
jgi:hypothetical protein